MPSDSAPSDDAGTGIGAGSDASAGGAVDASDAGVPSGTDPDQGTTLAGDAGMGTPDSQVSPDAAAPIIPGAGVPTLKAILSGSLASIKDGVDGIEGRAQLLRMLSGETTVQLVATGLVADTNYMAHVHALPCEYAGGGHYKIDPNIAETVETNELWLRFATDANGVGLVEMSSSHPVRGDALSVVIHDPADSSKLACADLLLDDETLLANGTFSAFAAADPSDAAIGGTVTMTVSQTSTVVEAALTGLARGRYSAHVHALPCEVMSGGGHYKIDPLVTEALRRNELWWANFLVGDSGQAEGLIGSTHTVRADAQSMVVHRQLADGTTPKIACANLTIDPYPVRTTAGEATLFAAGTERGYSSLAASAKMTRYLDGTTGATLDVTGLPANQSFGAHVHALPCAVQSGGGHYKIDPAVAGAVETNELWLSFTTDDLGAASSTAAAEHLARPEAMAVVIHDPSDGARIACIDLR